MHSKDRQPGQGRGSGRFEWWARFGFAAVAALGLALSLAFVNVPLPTEGVLDPSFGDNGTLTTSFGIDSDTAIYDDYADAVAIDPRGRIVAAGSSGNCDPSKADCGYGYGWDYGFGVARYDAGGGLDRSFSGDGLVRTDFPKAQGWVPDEHGNGVAIDSEGRIVVAGSAFGQNTGPDFALVRYKPNGSLDTSFSGDGKLTTDFDRGGDGAHAVAIDSEGRIVAAGGSSSGAALARYQPGGSLDTSFGRDGKVTTPWDIGGGTASGLAIDSRGRIVIAGTRFDVYNNPAFFVARYTPDGRLDTSFAGDGRETTGFGGRQDLAYAVTIDSRDRVVVGGEAYVESVDSREFGLVRYNPNGSLDRTFSGDGKVTTLIARQSAISAVGIDYQGRIVAAGWSAMPDADSDFTLARYEQNGSLDGSFGFEGKVKTPMAEGAEDDMANAMAIDYRGRIVVAGQADAGKNALNDFALARYIGGPGDVTPPETTITSGPANGSATKDQTPTFAFKSSEPGSSFRCWVDEKVQTCTSPFTTKPLADGDHVFKVRATDPAGNTDGTPATRSFTVDTKPPQTTITAGPADGGTTADPTPTFRFKSSEAGSSFRCRVDGGAFRPCSSPYTTAKLDRGLHTFRVRATDNAGNTDPTPATRHFTVEKG